MPSQLHEALLLLFRNRPALAPELLRDALHVPLPCFTEARIESAELTDVQPAEYRADLVVLFYEGTPVLGIVVEVQLRADADKAFSWPVYVAGLRFGPLPADVIERVRAAPVVELDRIAEQLLSARSLAEVFAHS